MASSYTLVSQLSGQSDTSTAGSSGSFDFQAQWSSNNNNNSWCPTGTDSGSSSSRNSSSIAPPWPYATLNNKVFDFVEASDDRCVATLEAPHGGGGVVSLALDGDLLYSGSDAAAGDVRVWRHNTSTDSHTLTSAGERLRTRGGRGGAVKAMVPVAGGLYSAHQDRKLRVWRREEQKKEQKADDCGNNLSLAGTLPTLKDYVVSFLPPSNYVRVRRHHKALWIRHADTVSVLVAGADVLYSASWDKSIKVWRLSDHKCLESLLAHDDAINALAVDQANAFLYSGGADAKIKVWARILPDGSAVPFTTPVSTPLATPSTPGQEVEQQENVGRRPLLRSQPSASNLLSPSLVLNQQQPHGRRSSGYMSSPADPKMLHSLGGIGGKKHHRFKGTSPLHPHARNRHGSHALVATLEGHGSAINALALSPDAALLYSASGDASISVWEREDSARHMSFAAVLRGHRQAVLSLAVSSPSSSSQENYLLCSGSADATIRIWRRRNYSQSAHHVCVAVLQGHRGPVKSLALRDNGMFLYSGGMDRDIRVWSLLGLQQTANKQQKLEARGKAAQERDNSGSTFSTGEDSILKLV